MRVIVGLGNPGSSYNKNRHNVGFTIVDYIAQEHSLSFSKKKNYDYATNREMMLVKPQTYMNRSGAAIVEALRYTNYEGLLVVVDDINLPLASVRIREKGGDGGHNGLKSVSEHLGNENYTRIRIGVGRPQGEMEIKNFVLSDFSKKENEILSHTKKFVSSLIDAYISKGYNELINCYSKTQESYSSLVKELESIDQRRKDDSEL